LRHIVAILVLNRLRLSGAFQHGTTTRGISTPITPILNAMQFVTFAVVDAHKIKKKLLTIVIKLFVKIMIFIYNTISNLMFNVTEYVLLFKYSM
jgi:hypothetical protein